MKNSSVCLVIVALIVFSLGNINFVEHPNGVPEKGSRLYFIVIMIFTGLTFKLFPKVASA